MAFDLEGFPVCVWESGGHHWLEEEQSLESVWREKNGLGGRVSGVCILHLSSFIHLKALMRNWEFCGEVEKMPPHLPFYIRLH